MQAVKLTENIYWVGAVDYDIRSFHGYKTRRGVTYNAYLVIDEKITLIDSVKQSFTDEMLSRIASVVDVSKIDYIVSNHAEFDHSGAIKTVADLSNARVLATAAGVKALANLYGQMQYISVKPYEELCTGKFTFTFLPTPMVHWPDNMMCALKSEGILFSNDAFGQHLATSARFDSEVDVNIALAEAEKYFANIVLPYRAQAAKALASLEGMSINTIASSHGIIWREHTDKIIELYKNMCSGVKQDSAVIVYDTMWGNTKALAQKIGAHLETKYKNVYYFNLAAEHESDILPVVMNCKLLAVGSPTLNNNYMPRVAAFLSYLSGLKPEKLDYVAFGSFGWGGGAVKAICSVLDGLGYDKKAELSLALAAPIEESMLSF